MIQFQSDIQVSITKKLCWILLILWIVCVGAAAYLLHPPISIFNQGFIFWGISLFVFLKLLALLLNKQKGVVGFFASLIGFGKQNSGISKTISVVSNVLFLCGVAWVIVSPLVMSPIFHANSYANRIDIKSEDFSAVNEVDFTKIPIIDRESTMVLGDRVMGEMPELVSQFTVSNEYTQISYRDSVYRVTPLEYAGFVKYFTNRSEGIPAYILVNSVTGEAELVKLKDLGLDGMKYVPSAYFNENLYRRLQISYPNAIFGAPSFEIDDEGHPWYVCTIYSYSGFETKQKVSGVVLFDPITGESTKYDDILKAPKWVDRIYPESLIIQEVDNNGAYQGGFINSILGQKNVTKTSEGYNYLEQDGDIYIYSGITSVNDDASNLAFVLVNLRTHEAMKIACAGANEASAMRSAQGEVKNYGYNATFPLLVNVDGLPTYMLSLKDDNGLIKMYAMVSATDYQKVAIINSGESFDTLKKNYLAMNPVDDQVVQKTKKATITIQDIKILPIEDTTRCFITDTENRRYKITLSSQNENVVAFLKAQDEVMIEYVENEDVNTIKSIEVK